MGLSRRVLREWQLDDNIAIAVDLNHFRSLTVNCRHVDSPIRISPGMIGRMILQKKSAPRSGLVT